MKRCVYGVCCILLFTAALVMAEISGDSNSSTMVCAPEPATFAVLAIGSVAFILHRRR
jgi:hypothetical protein